MMGAVMVAGSAVALALGGTAFATTVVSTLPPPGVGPFTSSGGSRVAIGQVIVAPAGEGALSDLTLAVNSGTTVASYTIEVYAWNGSTATGSALYTSAAQTGSGLKAVSPNIAVTPGVSYIAVLDAASSGGLALGIQRGNNPYGQDAFETNGAPVGGSWSDLGTPMGFSATFTAAVVVNSTPTPGPRGAYCTAAPVLRADGTRGQFVDLAAGQNVSDPAFAGATAAWYGQGYGLTCDNLPGLAYKDAGYKVDGDGVHTGTADDIYEFFTKSG
jgi:hypothetical protein